MLKVENLTVCFGEKGSPEAVTDVSFELKEKEKIAIIGETGSGKSVLLQAMLKMLPETATINGNVYLEGKNILTLSEKEMNHIRGVRISYVPQGS